MLPKVFILSLFMYVQTFSNWASHLSNAYATSQDLSSSLDLSKLESRALDKLELTREDLNEMRSTNDFSPLKDKLNEARQDIQDSLPDSLKDSQISKEDIKNDIKEKLDDAKNKLKNKLNEKKQNLSDKLKARVEDEKAKLKKEVDNLSDVKKDADNVVKGYIASTVSLTLLAIFAPAVLKACTSKPSAITYATTAAVYVINELQNSQQFKTKNLAEIELVKVALDSSQGIGENLETAKKALNMQLDILEKYKSSIDRMIESIDKKARAAKIASIGFGAASAIALGETLFFDAGACVGKPELEAVTTVKPNVPNTRIQYLIANIFNTLISKSYAQSTITVEKQVVEGQLKSKSKEIKLAGDADKILAILLGGAGSLLLGYFVPSYNLMLTKIVSSGTGRSIVFGANALVAKMAADKYKEAANSFMAKSRQVQELIDKARHQGNGVIDLGLEILDLDEVNQISNALGLGDARDIDINTAGDKIRKRADDLKDDLRSKFDNLKDDLKDDVKNEVKDKIQESLPTTLPTTPDIDPTIPSEASTSNSIIQSLLNVIFPNAYANKKNKKSTWRCYVPEKCSPPQMPKLTHKSLAPFNSFLSNFNQYSRAVYNTDKNRDKKLNKVENKILTFDKTIEKARQKFEKEFNRKRKTNDQKPIPFEQSIAKEAQRIEAFVMKSIALPQKGGGVHAVASSPYKTKTPNKNSTSRKNSTTDNFNKKPILTLQEYKALTKLLERLGQTTMPHLSHTDDTQNFFFISLHPKESSLFNILGHRYQKLLPRLLSD